MKTLTRFPVMLLALLASAWSFQGWLNRLVTFRAFKDRDRFDHGFGLTDPVMEWQWRRVWAHLPGRSFDPPPDYQGNPGSLYHDLKNLTTEWTRSIAERSSKFFAWCIVVLFLLAVAGWAAAWWRLL